MSSSLNWITISTCGSAIDTTLKFYDRDACECIDCGNCGTGVALTYYKPQGFADQYHNIWIFREPSSNYGSYQLSVTCGWSAFPPSTTSCQAPTWSPTSSPTIDPTNDPTAIPTAIPSAEPSELRTTPHPSSSPNTPTSSHTTSCPSYQYECSSFGKCIPSSYVCDGYDDCYGGDDEENCSGLSTEETGAIAASIIIVIVVAVICCCCICVCILISKCCCVRKKRPKPKPTTTTTTVIQQPAQVQMVQQPVQVIQVDNPQPPKQPVVLLQPAPQIQPPQAAKQPVVLLNPAQQVQPQQPLEPPTPSYEEPILAPEPVSEEVVQAQRTTIQRRIAFAGMVLALGGTVLHIIDMVYTSDCIASIGADLAFTDVGEDILKMILALLSLLINIVNFKSGGYDDCGSLRMMLMMIICLWWCKYIKSCRECYDKLSVKLLIGFNSLLWVILFLLDLRAFLEEKSEAGEDDMIELIMRNRIARLKFIKLGCATLGFIQSQGSLLWKLCGHGCKAMACCGKALCIILCCCCCCIIIIVIIIIAIGAGLYAASADDTDDTSSRRLLNTPTMSPTEPTECPISLINWKFPDIFAPSPTTPYTSYVEQEYSQAQTSYFLTDPYERFTISADIVVEDRKNVYGINKLCQDCFIWQYREPPFTGNSSSSWIPIDIANNPQTSMTITKNDQDIIINQLTMQTGRRFNAGRCGSLSDPTRIFQPEGSYQLRLQVISVNNAQRSYQNETQPVNITTNSLPVVGDCSVPNIEAIQPTDLYNLRCNDISNEPDLEYNALLNNVRFSEDYVNDPNLSTSYAASGNVTITILVREATFPTRIGCYPFIATFPTINETNIDNTLNIIDNGTANTLLATDPDLAVAYSRILNNVYQDNLVSRDNVSGRIDNLATNIIRSSSLGGIVVNQTKGNVTRVGENLVDEVTALSAVTLNTEIVDDGTAVNLIRAYLPNLLSGVPVLFENDYEDNLKNDLNGRRRLTESNDTYTPQDTVYSISEAAQALIVNLENSVSARPANSTNITTAINTDSEALIDFAASSASQALLISNPGETFNYKNSNGTKVVVAQKFVAELNTFFDLAIEDEDIVESLPSCGSDTQFVTLPVTLLQQETGVLDCTFISSTTNNFIPSISNNRTIQSGVVSINVIDPSETIENARRRRLMDNNTYDNDTYGDGFLGVWLNHISDECHPYLIKIKTDTIYDPSFGDNDNYPSCDFWDVENSKYDTSGCDIYEVIDGDTVICGCTHLTSFVVSKDEEFLEARTLKEIDWKALTLENLWYYPTVWVTFFVIGIVMMFIGCVNPRQRISEKSIIAFQDVIYESFRERKLWADITGKEIKYISEMMPNPEKLGQGIKPVIISQEDKKSFCELQTRLYRAYLRNDHTFASLFQRTAGTNLSLKQRLGLFFMFITTNMVMTATFYGTQQTNIWGSIIASLLISLCSTVPVIIVRKLFEKSKPNIDLTTRKERLLDEEDDVDELEDALLDTSSWATMKMDTLSQSIRRSTIGGKNKDNKYVALTEIRKTIYNDIYPLPTKTKKVAWIILILWSVAAGITAMVYGLAFDLEYVQVINEQNSRYIDGKYDNACWNVSYTLKAETRLSNEEFAAAQAAKRAENAASYGGSDAKSWLISLFQSILVSMVIWQPLTIYVFTWIKLWAFTYRLKLSIGPGNVKSLCKRCCCGYKPEPDVIALETSIAGGTPGRPTTSAAGVGAPGEDGEEKHDEPLLDKQDDVTPGDDRYENERVAFRNRPIDVWSFLSRDELTINDHEAYLMNATSTRKKKEIKQEVELQAMGSGDVDDMDPMLAMQQKINRALAENKDLKRRVTSLKLPGMSDNNDNKDVNASEARKVQVEVAKNEAMADNDQEPREDDNEVSVWLNETVKLPEYDNIFKEQGVVDMETLKLLKEDQLKDMGIKKIGHVIRLKRFIDKLNVAIDEVQVTEFVAVAKPMATSDNDGEGATDIVYDDEKDRNDGIALVASIKVKQGMERITSMSDDEAPQPYAEKADESTRKAKQKMERITSMSDDEELEQQTDADEESVDILAFEAILDGVDDNGYENEQEQEPKQEVKIADNDNLSQAPSKSIKNKTEMERITSMSDDEELEFDVTQAEEILESADETTIVFDGKENENETQDKNSNEIAMKETDSKEYEIKEEETVPLKESGKSVEDAGMSGTVDGLIDLVDMDAMKVTEQDTIPEDIEIKYQAESTTIPVSDNKEQQRRLTVHAVDDSQGNALIIFDGTEKANEVVDEITSAVDIEEKNLTQEETIPEGTEIRYDDREEIKPMKEHVKHPMNDSMRMTQNIDGLLGLVDIDAMNLTEQETIPEDTEIRYQVVDQNEDADDGVNIAIEPNQLAEDNSTAL